MRCIQDVREMREACRTARREGKTLGFVPTMGGLHAGHASLIERACRECDAAAISLFVNPTQFGPGEDYGSYPRTWEEDLRLARSLGVDLVFHPDVAEMYPKGFSTHVEVERLAAGLCGRHRPGHFRGVATVVLKLFAVVRPHRAYFGEKDYQQLVLIRRMVEDLSLEVEVVGCPIVRDPDGLALSSRNAYLNAEERRRALALHRGLGRARSLLAAGERRAAALEAAAREELEREGLRVDYASVVHPDTLEPLERVEAPARMAVAAWVGRARLIDNCPLDPPQG
ncbi:MAG: pantoate--beta-alanine ligase [Nitrospinota bacterium]